MPNGLPPMKPILQLLTIALTTLSSLSSDAQTKSPVKSASRTVINEIQLARFKVMDIKENRRHRNYVWLDNKTVLYMVEFDEGSVDLEGHHIGDHVYTTNPPRAFPELMKALEEYRKRSGPVSDLYSIAISDRIGVNFCNHFTLFTTKGEFLGEVLNDKPFTQYSPDGMRLGAISFDQNTNKFYFHDVPLVQPKQAKQPKIPAKGPSMFRLDEHHFVNVGLRGRDVYGLSFKRDQEYSKEDLPDTKAVYLLKYSLNNPNAKPIRKSLELPKRGIITWDWFAPSGKQFIEYVDSQTNGAVWLRIGHVDQHEMRTLLFCPKDSPGNIGMDLKWKPNGKEISFIWKGALYAIPIN